jgi:hypothetical protein
VRRKPPAGSVTRLLETVLAEAVTELVDASFRAEKEIERFQRRLAGCRKAVLAGAQFTTQSTEVR